MRRTHPIRILLPATGLATRGLLFLAAGLGIVRLLLLAGGLTIVQLLLLAVSVSIEPGASAQVAASDLQLNILSPETLNGTAGDFVTVRGTISNVGDEPVSDITTYLSLVDTENKLPVDLEDWSAEKGLFIGTIDPGQVFPLDWKIHFVKAGRYNLVIIASRSDRSMPEVSGQTTLVVKSKQNLNPGKVLPVALGTPILVAFVLLLAHYRRQRQLD
jgi:hypothetical protein